MRLSCFVYRITFNSSLQQSTLFCFCSSERRYGTHLRLNLFIFSVSCKILRQLVFGISSTVHIALHDINGNSSKRSRTDLDKSMFCGLPERVSSSSFVLPSKNLLFHFFTVDIEHTSSPYTSLSSA